MVQKLLRLLRIDTRFEAYAVIYALAVGATGRGLHYLGDYPGFWGWLMFFACLLAVFMAGAKILDATPGRWKGRERRVADRSDRRRVSA